MSPSENASAPGEETVSDDEALRRMYRITSDHDRSLRNKIGDLLSFGRTYLDVQAGFLTEVSDGAQLIVEASGDHELLQPGKSCPLSKAYCRKTIEQEDALTVQHAALEGWENDAAYEEFGLESYIGAKVIVEGDVYGTFCFADEEPRRDPFTDQEEVFVELMAEWVSYELYQKRAAEHMEKQRDQLEEFASVVSHDLRNPLGVVQGYLDLAEETGDPEHFDRCRNAVERMEALIDDLLLLAREGESIAETESIELAEMTNDCWEFVPTEDATLEVDGDVVITGDWSRVQQLFENLFRNAVEHGGGDVTVRVGVLENDSGIYVEDDGNGIPEEKRDQIFSDGYSTAGKGSGFGLTIVQQIVDAHDWNIRVTDSSTGGARFEIIVTEIDT
jgi:signal transduction histidine kinase